MQKFKSALFPNIGNISIALGAIGIISHLLSTYSKKLSFLSYFVITYIQDYTYLFLNNGLRRGMPVSPVTLLFLLMLLIGGIIYKRTNAKDSRLLRFVYSIVFIKGLLSLITRPLGYLHFQNLIDSGTPIRGELPTIFTYFLPWIYIIPIATIAYFFTKWLIADQQLFLIERTLPNGNVVKSPKKMSRGKRFTHLVFDYIVMLLIVSPLLMSAMNYFGGKQGGITNLFMSSNRFLLSIMIAVGFTIYYLLFEGFFNASPVKFLTGSRVIDEKTFENPGFGKILGRTLSRRIPFEAFSFFGTTGWHDSVSGTEVVAEDNSGTKRSYNAWWGVLIIGIYVVALLFPKVDRILDQGRRDNFVTQASISQHEASIGNLNAGDILAAKSNTSDYRAPNILLRVIKSNNGEITAQQLSTSVTNRFDRKTAIATLNNLDYTVIDTIKTTKNDLLLAFNKGRRKGLILEDSLSFRINQIFDMDHPEIKSGSTSWKYNDGDQEWTFNLSHDLTPIEIIDIKQIKGSIKWQVALPVKSTFNEQFKQGEIQLTAKNISARRTHRSELTLRYNNEDHIYIMEGLNRKLRIYRKHVDR
jgi:hypothetical protein